MRHASCLVNISEVVSLEVNSLQVKEQYFALVTRFFMNMQVLTRGITSIASDEMTTLLA